jgi:hypothetical protein
MNQVARYSGALLVLLTAAACTFDTTTSGLLGDGGIADASADAGNAPPSADDQAVVVIQDTGASITLTGSDPEGQALSFAISSTPLHGDLSGTPPALAYKPDAGYVGDDSFAFVVTDSEGQTASALVAITVITTPPAIYEPFDYPAGPLGGLAGTTEIGLAGSWTQSASNPSNVIAGSLSFGDLATTGGQLLSPGGLNRLVGARPISAQALADAGLLGDGAELWFSAIVGVGAGANQTNTVLDFALASASFGTENTERFIQEVDNVVGAGIGFTLARGVPRAASFLPAGNPLLDATASGAYAVGEHGLVVGRIVWGATPADADTVELFRPSADLATLGGAISKIDMVVDQATFDTLTMQRGDRPVVDEIRFGPSLISVL